MNCSRKMESEYCIMREREREGGREK